MAPSGMSSLYRGVRRAWAPWASRSSPRRVRQRENPSQTELVICDEPVESPFASVRLRTTAAKRYKRVENATAMIWKLLLVAEQTFRKVNAPELMAKVAAGATYVNGIRSWPQATKDQAA
jgi:hypothetical protein